MSRKKLVIISVPFVRIARVTLSKSVLSTLANNADILVVAPFADEKNFKDAFLDYKLNFAKWDESKISGLTKLLLKLPDFVRRLGYWQKYKTQGLEYYVKNSFVVFGANGHDKKLARFQRVVFSFLAKVGKNQFVWKGMESMLGNKWYQMENVEQFSQKYPEVTLVQSANWGLQDRALARISEKTSWRKVFIPYTTDQILFNGFLINKFDAVCVQGELERLQAGQKHQIPDSRLFLLGSCWFRNIDKMRSEIGKRKSTQRGYIIYAGILNTYYSTQGEFLALDALANLVSKQKLQLEIIYRPVVFDKELRKTIENRYADSNLIKIEWPSNAVIGLADYQPTDLNNSLKSFIERLENCQLLVASRLTSIYLDAAYIAQCGVIGNMIDTDGAMQRRHSQLLYNKDNFPGVSFVHSEQELIEAARLLLANKEVASQQAHTMISAWDYPDNKFDEILVDACFGER